MQTKAPTKAQEFRKEKLITAMIEIRAELLSAVKEFPESRGKQVFLGTWSLLDLLAHLSGWDDANIAAIRRVRAGKLPGYYAFIDPDWRTYNARLVKKYRQDALSDQITLARDSHARMVKAVRAIPADAINRDYGVRFRGYKVTIRRIVDAEIKDDTVHLAQVREFSRGPHGKLTEAV